MIKYTNQFRKDYKRMQRQKGISKNLDALLIHWSPVKRSNPAIATILFLEIGKGIEIAISNPIGY